MSDPLVLSTPVQVRLFGLPALTDTTGAPRPLAPAAGQLLAYLLLFPAPISRERLAETLWPDQTPGYARRRLSDALYRLRRAIEPDWLSIRGSTLALGPQPPEVDLWMFERLATGVQPTDLEQAVALYQADLLADLDAEWALPRRLAVRELFLDCLLRLGLLAEAAQQPTRAAAYFRRLAAEDPLREEAHQGLMRALAQSGRYGEALDAYSHLERILDAELGLPPTSASAELAAQIRAERTAAEQRDQDANERLTHPPFVGRRAERARLLERLDQARAGRGGLTLVLGEAGIGKSRLLEEFAAAATLRGWQVAAGRAEETRTSGLLSEALAHAIHGPRAQQLARLVPAPLLAIAARIVPELSQTPAPAHERPDIAQLAASIAAVLGGLGSIAPHLMILDDLHWAAPDLWPLLQQLHPLLNDLPVLIVLAGRSEELRAQPAWRQVEAWDAAGVPLLELSGLAPAELAELAQACRGTPGFRIQDSGLRSARSSAGERTATASAEAQANVNTRLHSASNGNPLIALTLLRAQALHADAPPPSLAGLVERRLALLTPEPRRALQAAAVLGARVDYTLWEATLAAAGVAPEQTPSLAGALEHSGFLVPEGSGYRFAHDTLRSVVYSRLPALERRRWHTMALAAVHALRPDAAPTRLYHAEGAADEATIVAAAVDAGEQALQSIAPASARQFFTRALDALPPTQPEQRYRALLGRTRAAAMLADTAAQQSDLRTLADLAAQIADPQLQLDVLREQVELQWTTGNLDQAEALAETGVTLARRIAHPAGETALLEAQGRASPAIAADSIPPSACSTLPAPAMRRCMISSGKRRSSTCSAASPGVTAITRRRPNCTLPPPIASMPLTLPFTRRGR